MNIFKKFLSVVLCVGLFGAAGQAKANKLLFATSIFAFLGTSANLYCKEKAYEKARDDESFLVSEDGKECDREQAIERRDRAFGLWLFSLIAVPVGSFILMTGK